MRFYRQRPMPFANLSKSIQPGNPTGKADGSAGDPFSELTIEANPRALWLCIELILRP
jgi:hypothetical protein